MQKVLKEAKWRIPCFDQIFTISQRQRTKTSSNAVPGYRELRSQACQAYVIAMEHLHNRKPFIPSEGYVRLVPAHSRPGDIVCIIFGADVPFVLRDVGEGEYQLIGEAYVFGIMDGEFVKGDSREEIFCLC
jgi:hypothetical protein